LKSSQPILRICQEVFGYDLDETVATL